MFSNDHSQSIDQTLIQEWIKYIHINIVFSDLNYAIKFIINFSEIWI